MTAPSAAVAVHLFVAAAAVVPSTVAASAVVVWPAVASVTEGTGAAASALVSAAAFSDEAATTPVVSAAVSAAAAVSVAATVAAVSAAVVSAAVVSVPLCSVLPTSFTASVCTSEEALANVSSANVVRGDDVRSIIALIRIAVDFTNKFVFFIPYLFPILKKCFGFYYARAGVQHNRP